MMMPVKYISVKDYYLNKKRLPKHIPYSIQTAPQYIFNISTNVAWNKMFRTSFVKSEHLWFEEIPRANDQYFVVMATAKAQRITIVDKGADELSDEYKNKSYIKLQSFTALHL